MSDDYQYMTTKSWSDSEVDALLRGRRPSDPELLELSPWLVALNAELDRPVAESEVATVSPRLAMAARETVVVAIKPKAVWVRRVAVGGLAAVALGFGFAGAAAADSSAPGDSLYGLDRALERVGVHAGGLKERLEEAQELADRGDTDGAMDLLADSLDDAGDAEGKQALLDVAAKLRENGSEQSADVHAGVADMLAWMALTTETGKEFGQGVAEHARAINGAPDAKPSPAPEPAKPSTAGEGKPSDPGNAEGGSDGSSDGNSDGKGKPTTTPAPKGGKP